MAYIIYTNDYKLMGIADNDTDRDNYTGIELYRAIEISDTDYLKVKNNEASVGDYDTVNSQHNITDIDILPIEDGDFLENYLHNVKIKLKTFLEIPANESKSIWTRCNDYNTYLQSLDTSTLTYPINTTWEKYCSDNSIGYVSPLQIY